MDKVFQEEQKNLAEIESKIDVVASQYERKAKKLQADIADFYVVDYDDVQQKRELIQERESVTRFAEQFRAYQASPYFGRLDLDRVDADESATFYIGKEGISDSAESIVVDWRTPIGSCYYAANQKEFSVNNTKYLLALRRALDVKNGILVSYRTEYDGETVSLEGDVIDPFLLTVLKDKRRHNRLTDIIRTIQANQNDIIRKPRTESFVVQGCAGSGKTMILLHRLSFLKFNNRNMSLGGVKIITPNKYFDAHINDLSIELGLNSIARFSVEEYYVALIKRYSSKITTDPDVRSEKTLSNELLSELYSLQYLYDSISHYHSYWTQVLSSIDEDKLRLLFGRLQISYPNTTLHLSDTAAQLEYGLRQISAAMVEHEKKQENVASRIAGIDSEISAAQTECDRISSALELTKKQTLSRLKVELAALNDGLQSRTDNLAKLRKERAELRHQLKQAEQENAKHTTTLQVFSRDHSLYSDYSLFILQMDAASKLIRSECAEIIATIIETETAYDQTPVYNFGKRNNLRRKLTDSKEQFSRAVSDFIYSQVLDAKNSQEAIASSLISINERISALDESISLIEKEQSAQKSRSSALNECLQLFDTAERPDTKTELPPLARRECAKILAIYEEQRSSFLRFSHRVSSFVQTKQVLLNEQQELASTGYSPDEKNYVANCSIAVKKLQFSEISRNVMFRDLLARYKAHNQTYQKTNYRHKLYLKLLYCAIYFSHLSNPDNFLNIDEAQDISVAEYYLLRLVLGDNCIFNLYGDINQSVYSYKGITDWDDIANITTQNIYVLNENYRNTLQVTEFCNKEFGAEVYPIGVSGEPVIEQDTAAAVTWILEIKKRNPEYRVAILHRHGVRAIQDLLHALLAEQNVSWYAVDEKRLSVVSVETAKGLEFEAVVAIVDQMSSNEKYIAYTRALELLSVVRDTFSAGLDADEGAEEIDDEFIEQAEPISDIQNVQPKTYTDLINVLSAYLSSKKSADGIIDNADILSDAVSHDSQTSAIPRVWPTGAFESSKPASPLSQEESMLMVELNSILEERFGDGYKLSSPQQQIICSLYHGNKVAFNAPSGSMKSVILYLLAVKEHQTSGKQTILTSDSHLQENELVLADRLGLKGGIITESMDSFLADFKKDKYDVIFVPYDFFQNHDNVGSFIDYFSDRVAYWGLDHPAAVVSIWMQLQNCCNAMGATMYLMSKVGFTDLDLNGFNYYEINSAVETDIVQKQNLGSVEDKLKWVLLNLDKLYGQGLIYCDDEATCKALSKYLRKNKIMAEAYVEVVNPEKKERINYLTNAFSNGGLPVLVTTHEVGKNLSNPRIRFVLHYDMPTDESLHLLHIAQIGQLSEDPRVYDLHVV